MCFSATASFAAGALLLGIGTLTLSSALATHRRRDLPFAAIPLLFAVQQMMEGVIWLTFRAEATLLNSVMTHMYSFFSHVLWPVWVPVAVLLREPAGCLNSIRICGPTRGSATCRRNWKAPKTASRWRATPTSKRCRTTT